ncbi:MULTISPECIES: putative lipid II flippase FtsW [unclassified Clostridium]|uniref:putative lipid II flippase FtsW n=1 Tax=unclassified Clostridium TaxID=2614128 RepID=UPI0018985C62|nr:MULTISPECIES: putative lipid II flippase FtsW [unclassified Clostridium]MBP3915507.1 putative lipid II flippase FtsW [Clostridium sp.]MEE0933531.1 putative lipid II flippase FtsW [Clostridium sp.]
MSSNSKRLKKGKNKKKVKRKSKLGSVNPYILYSVLALVAIGIIMVFSASYYDALYKHKDVFYFLKKELTWVPVGLVALVVMMLIDYHLLKKFTVFAYGVTVVALVAVLFVGSTINGAKRWLNIAGISFQPSELAKYVIVFFLAMMIDKYGKVNRNWKIPLIYLGSAALFALLVYKENNLSIAAIIMFVAFIMIFVSGMSFKETFALIGIGGVAGTIGIFSSDYRTERFISFLDPWKYANDEGYQLVHSLYALGSGGLFGVGLGNSKQKALYMPEPHNDFIFSIIGEELGLIGCIFVIAIFVVLIVSGIKVASRAKDRYGKLLATGIISVIAVQAIINIAVVTGSMPVTGVPLPFISYGGTSLVFNLAAMGVLLNISRQCKNPKDEIEEKIIKSKMNV